MCETRIKPPFVEIDKKKLTSVDQKVAPFMMSCDSRDLIIYFSVCTWLFVIYGKTGLCSDNCVIIICGLGEVKL